MALFIVEAITNAMKYAFGQKGGVINVSLAVDETGTTLKISDNGRGYDPSAPSDQESGRGLGSKLMSAFSRQLAGSLNVDASPGGGCQLTLHMPNQD
jgi:two-component sensor histidine kinase